ncbi:MAG: aminoacyl-tRNA hydrolase [Syntrophobacterales bacterium]|nr:MAG: aminoacyl-tRNA hydrolase [Syntrophobacterales bacterium]
MNLIIGLGNPGRRYRFTRHNTGFLVIDELARRNGIGLGERRYKTRFGRGLIKEHEAIVAKPLTFMNLSGLSVGRIMKVFNLSEQDLIVIHDDVDIDFGRIKISQGGGPGGHKGIESIQEFLAGSGFSRIKVGLGRPKGYKDTSDYVLEPFSDDEKILLEGIISRAAESVETLICEGLQIAMSRFN